MEKEIIKKIQEKLNIIDDERFNGMGIDKNNEMLIHDAINNNLPILNNIDKLDNDYYLHAIEKASGEIYNTVKLVNEDLDIKKFFSDGKTFDTKRLMKEYKESNLKSKYPKLDIKKYLSCLNKPILELKNFKGETIKYDPYWVKKNLIAINQMIFNEMDLYILNIGKEGSGKSCWSSQQILYFYEFFKLVGLIDYAYDIQKMFFIDILSLLEEHSNQKKNDYFRIECLDEGNELNRSNFREDSNQQFKYEMRTERKMLRVFIINMQQIGELDTSISLSRVNFIYNCKMRSNNKLGTLNKGFIDMYIIPRGDEIFSEKYKKIISRSEILNLFANKLDKKKDYYVSLPREVIVNNFKFENYWGFDKEEYDSYVKDEMNTRKFQKNIKFSDDQAYIMLKKLSNFIELGTFDRVNNPKDKQMYDSLKKAFYKINKYFEGKPERYNSLEKKYYGEI